MVRAPVLRDCPLAWPSAGMRSVARIAKRRLKFNGGPYLREKWAWGTENALPAVQFELHLGAAAPSRQHAILILAHPRHGVGQPEAGADQENHEYKSHPVHDHAVTVIVDVGAALIFREIVH